MVDRTDPDRATLVAFLAIVILGGANGIAVKVTVAELAPLWGAALRFVLAGAVLVGIVLISRRPWPRGQSLRGAALYGLVGFTASYGLVYTGIRDVPAGTTMVLISLTPLFTFGLAIAQRQERFHARGLAGAMIALLGVAIVFADQLGNEVPLLSLLLIVLGSAAIAESAVVVKWIPKADPFATNAIAMLVGGAVLLGVSFLTGEPHAVPTITDTLLALVYLVLLGSVAVFTLYLFALKRWTASAVSYVTLLMPVVTVALATLFVGEPIRASFLVGSAVIGAGVYVGAFMSHRPRRSTASSLPECLPAEDCATAPVTVRA